MRRPPLTRSLLLCALIAALALHEDSHAQKAGPTQPNPQAPTLAIPGPVGAQRGTTIELNLTGTNLADPVTLWTSFPAKVTIPTDANNGKDAAKLRLALDIPADAPVGLHAIRLATTRGISNARLFCVDDLPQVLEVDSNRSRSTPQAVPVPCVVAGKTEAESSDYYKITAKAGQRLSFEVLGRRLGGPIDPQLTLSDPRTGRELAGGHSNDAPGCQTDPRLTHTFKEEGEYVIEVRDVTYRGGADYWYRLRIGDFPCAVAPFPMAAKRGSKVKVGFTGPTVEGVAPVEVVVPDDPTVDAVWVAPKGPGGLHGWPVALAVSNMEELTEQEPNHEPGKANRVSAPCGISGRFAQAGDVDAFVFNAKKGQRLLIEAHTLEWYSPTLVYMTLKDAKGSELSKSNPQAVPPLDQRIDFTAPADGDFTLEVQHLNYAGGPSEAYRVTLVPYEPGFRLTLPLDRFDVPQGGAVAVPIILAARRDYNGPIEVSVIGPEGVAGKATIKEGQAAAPAPVATLILTAKPDLPMGPRSIVIQGQAMINGKPVKEFASVRGVVSTSLGNLPFPPRTMNTQVGLGITEKPPFQLTAQFDAKPTIPGKPALLTVTASRAAGFEDEITLAAAGLPANVTAALKTIPKGQSEAKGQLNTAANAPVGQHLITLTGKAKYKGRDYLVTSLPVTLTLAAAAFELKVEPAPIKLAPGGKAKVKVTAVRKTYQGPIEVELRNLPANVTAAKVTIAKDQTAAEIEISAAANAAAGDKADVHAVGTATMAGKLQVNSPNITLSVAKK